MYRIVRKEVLSDVVKLMDIEAPHVARKARAGQPAFFGREPHRHVEFVDAVVAIGVAVANAILLVTFAEQNRRNGADPVSAARSAAAERLRPVLMTSLAMIAGMIPMALAIGRGSEETAPLGRAVIGGLLFATLATLFLLPTVFAIVQKGASLESPSLDPEDADSPFAQKPETA